MGNFSDYKKKIKERTVSTDLEHRDKYSILFYIIIIMEKYASSAYSLVSLARLGKTREGHWTYRRLNKLFRFNTKSLISKIEKVKIHFQSQDCISRLEIYYNLKIWTWCYDLLKLWKYYLKTKFTPCHS